jgi:hypothetical protein
LGRRQALGLRGFAGTQQPLEGPACLEGARDLQTFEFEFDRAPCELEGDCRRDTDPGRDPGGELRNIRVDKGE